MLTLKEEQWNALMELARKNHLKETISILREMFPEDATKLSFEEFKLKCLNGYEKAMKYGFSVDEHIIEFIGLTFVWDGNFDTSEKNPWASEILSWKDTTPESRIKGLIAKSEYELDRKLEKNSRITNDKL